MVGVGRQGVWDMESKGNVRQEGARTQGRKMQFLGPATAALGAGLRQRGQGLVSRSAFPNPILLCHRL